MQNKVSMIFPGLSNRMQWESAKQKKR